MSGRIRTIKPEVLEDELASGLSDAAWRLWVSTWVLADDHGNVRMGAKYLAANVWQDTTRDVLLIVDELLRSGLVVGYAVHGQRYAHIKGWEKHQRVDNAGKPRVPGPEEDDGTWNQPHTGNTAASLGEAPTSAAIRRSRNLAAGPPTTDHRPPTTDHRPALAASAPPAVVTESKKSSRRGKTGIRSDWKPNDATVEMFRRQGVDAEAVVAEFVDYWLGNGSPMADWEATFRNRVRALVEQGRAPKWKAPSKPAGPPRDLLAEHGIAPVDITGQPPSVVEGMLSDLFGRRRDGGS